MKRAIETNGQHDIVIRITAALDALLSAQLVGEMLTCTQEAITQ